TFLTLAVPIQFSAWRITLAWAIEAVALAYIAKRLEAPRLYWLCAFMLFLVGSRVLMEDAWILRDPKQYTAVINQRFFILTWAALSYWLSAKFFRRNAFAGIIYVIGHVIFWGALAIEVAATVSRNTMPA